MGRACPESDALKTADRDRNLYAEYEELLSTGISSTGAIDVIAKVRHLAPSTIRKIIGSVKAKVRKEAWAQAAALRLVPRAKTQNYYDMQAWKDYQASFLRMGYVTIGHKSDVHAPFHDQDALELSYQADEYLKPQVMVVGSDFCDFPTISAYAPDPELANDDILDTLRPIWWNHIDAIKRAAPKSVLVWVYGNHDDRLFRFLDETAPQVRQTVHEAFVDFIRYQGQVLYLGRVSEIEVGVLTVLHGDSSVLGEYGARKVLMARRSQRWYMFGHGHTPKEHYLNGDEYPVGAAGGGHLSLPIPHYQKTGKFNNWIQGTCYGVVGMKEKRVWFNNLVFHRRDNLLTTVIGNRVLAQERSPEMAEAESELAA
jgi:hypothetical protein